MGPGNGAARISTAGNTPIDQVANGGTAGEVEPANLPRGYRTALDTAAAKVEGSNTPAHDGKRAAGKRT